MKAAWILRYWEKRKIKRNKELNETVDKIDQAITDNFYLKRTQEFQYKHY
jgi:hypothetical protein